MSTSVTLCDEELALLDGKCADKVQREVDAAKRRLEFAAQNAELSPEIAGFIADAVSRAVNDGELRFYHTSLRMCSLCKRTAGYAKYKGTGRHHRKGDTNHSKPLYFSGVDIVHSFIHMKGYATLGCCKACWEKAKPALAEALKDVRAVIPSEISGVAPRFQKFDNKKCKLCGWEGHEGEMGFEPAVFGGMYRGRCPKCPAKNALFIQNIETVKGFVVTEAK